MGCRGLCGYVKSNFHIFGRVHDGRPLNVVIDATNAQFCFHSMLCFKRITMGYDISLLQDSVDAFFYLLECENINVTHVVFDGVVDWDKQTEFGVREKQNLMRNESIWISSFEESHGTEEKKKDNSGFYSSIFFEYHFMKCIKNHVPLEKIVFTGVHADRESENSNSGSFLYSKWR